MPNISSQSSWQDVKLSHYPKLQHAIEADVVIVGGGLTGIVSAYVLAKTGKRVVLLEAETLGYNASSLTTAFITQAIDTDLSELVSLFGPKKARLIWESGQAAIGQIEKIIREEKINCNFMRCSVYEYATAEKDFEYLEEESQTAQKLGFKTTLGHDYLGIRHEGYLELPNQAKFHPLKFLNGVAQASVKRGTQIYEHSKVERIIRNNRSLTVKTDQGEVLARDVIIATYNPFETKGTRFKKGMYVSYVLEAKIQAGIIQEGLYWDQENPYHYLRLDRMKGFDRVIFGGEDHRAELKMSKAKNFRALEKHFKQLIGTTPYEITRKWTGPILEPVDGVALIGPIQNHLYVATGFSGNGMTYSNIAARIFTDAITGRKNEWHAVYNPRRVITGKQLVSKGRDYIEEFFGGAAKNIFQKGQG
ncbi:MAG: FAD-binding oxidoreductase [Candidatus Yanofskybacteria bacterium]|nr:FAD-binding oxidoreductase [Candidatus Yanofskybacteria bacterium]